MAGTGLRGTTLDDMAPETAVTRSTTQHSAGHKQLFCAFPCPRICSVSKAEALQEGWHWFCSAQQSSEHTQPQQSPSKAAHLVLHGLVQQLLSPAQQRLWREKTRTGLEREDTNRSRQRAGEQQSLGMPSLCWAHLCQGKVPFREGKLQRGPLSCTTSISQGLELLTSREMEAPE